MATGYKLMSVPDKIQLSTGQEDGTKQPQHRQMKVPDTITLGGSRDDISSSHVTGRGGVGILSSSAEEQSIQPEEIPYAGSVDINQRLESLEERVRKIEEWEGLRNIGHTSSGGPGKFWYAVTFSSWMMVPLIVVFLMYYKRQS
ncbi:PREDICTED: uncharacterized protein LOC105313665 [Amphimedon queenslandica]|uniref:Uncharacterized protein n=1 Tax=Amphimedon queenslandica TaxID=400682 RepID=A0A1X7UC17_AMPQE|nr:PREDICTED: uncharacterized protein LOC105313665 [Amphimedon queenslandica]|eukprot:XP_011405568.1 PREDICTED: uncharacterized protein LOC105313665 [Amphimedon queenslandica]